MSDRLNPRNAAVAWSHQLTDRTKLLKGFGEVGAFDEALRQLDLIEQDVQLARAAIKPLQDEKIRSKAIGKAKVRNRGAPSSPRPLPRARVQPGKVRGKALALRGKK